MYFAIIFGSIFLSFVYSKSKDPYTIKFSKIAFFLLLTVPLVIRMDIGTDYKNYVSVYNQLKTSGYNSVDVGWRIINNFFIFFNLPVQIILFLSGFFTVMFFSKDTKREDFFIWSLIFLSYLYFPAYNIVRQVLSISIAFFLLKRGKRDLINLVLLIIAISIHFSSIFFIIVLFDFKRFRLMKSNVFIISVFLFFVLSFIISPKTLLIKIMSMSKRYRYYVGVAEMMGNISSSGITIIFDFIVLVFLSYNMDKEKVTYNQENYIYVLLILSSVMFPLMRQFFIFARFKYSFYGVSLFLSMKQKNNKFCKQLLVLIFIMYSLFTLYLIVVRGNDGLYPYKSLLS